MGTPRNGTSAQFTGSLRSPYSYLEYILVPIQPNDTCHSSTKIAAQSIYYTKINGSPWASPVTVRLYQSKDWRRVSTLHSWADKIALLSNSMFLLSRGIFRDLTSKKAKCTAQKIGTLKKRIYPISPPHASDPPSTNQTRQ